MNGPKRLIPFHPILFAIYPALALYAGNLAIVPIRDVYLPALVVLGTTIGLWLILSLILRDVVRAAAGTSAFMFLIFAFEPVRSSVTPRFVSSLEFDQSLLRYSYIVVVTGLAVAAAWKSKANQFTCQLLNAMGSALIIVTSVGLASGLAQINRQVAGLAKLETKSSTAVSMHFASPPDIYYIVLDGYGRADNLKRLFNLDNQPFIEALRERGFKVLERNHSNYNQTQVSLASSLNMRLAQDLKLTSTDYDDAVRMSFASRVNSNAVGEFLHGIGYRYVAITTGFPGFSFATADAIYGGDHTDSLFEAALAKRTPFYFLESVGASQYDQRRAALQNGFASLKRLGQPWVAPKFVIAHILAPHPPFVFGPNGEPRRPGRLFGIFDGSHFYDNGGTPEEYRDGYRDQLEYVNKLVLSTVDAILKDATPRPVIVLQGDHGSKLHMDQNLQSATDLQEVFGNLMAILAPEIVLDDVAESMTPVNLFPTILNGLFQTDFPKQPDRSFYCPWEKPLDYQEVTDKLADEDRAEAAAKPK